MPPQYIAAALTLLLPLAVAYAEPVAIINAQLVPMDVERVVPKHTGPLPPDDPLYRSILQLERERMEAYRTNDLEYLDRSFADEYLHTNLRGGTTDKAGELAFYDTGEFALESGKVGDFRMYRYGDVVVATGSVSWQGATYRDIDLSGDFRVTRVYVLRDGHWQLATSHASKVGG